jgi:hypothetical protein
VNPGVLALLMTSIASSGVGLIGGYVLCLYTQRAAAEVSAPSTARRGLGWRTAGGIIILLLVAGSAWMSYATTTDQRQVAECQAEQNREFTAALAARSQATHDGNAAQRAFLQAVSEPNATPADRQRAYVTYLAALNKVDQIQAANPLKATDCS